MRHSVEVTAETLYETAALALSVFRQSEWADQISFGTELTGDREVARQPDMGLDIAARPEYAGTLLNVIPASDGWAHLVMGARGYENL